MDGLDAVNAVLDSASLFGGNWVVGGVSSLVGRLFRIYSARCFFG
jgi:hypothetical protein